MKYSFYNDYSEGAHPRILDLLSLTNFLQEAGYEEDSLSLKAKELIKMNFSNKGVDIHFISGGTQTNLIALSAMMKPYESVISVDSGHINMHEAGAVEATGHKINVVVGTEGKLTVDMIDSVVCSHTDEHMVRPRVVFISDSTELGTVYSKKELKDISDYCRKNNLYLYLDGARMGAALCAKGTDVDFECISSLCDVFYIGGTKNGALIGEALVIINEDLKKDFRFYLKQRGALLAKGRLLGVQFSALFEDGLFFELATHANEMAQKMALGIKRLGYDFLVESPTNQIFPILPNEVINELNELYGFYVWANINEKCSSIRLVTSWAIKEKTVSEFLNDLERIASK